MLFSPSAQQALRALIYLASQTGRGPVLVREISKAENIPRPFLAKLLHSLRNKGFVKSTKGPGGGYALARPPQRIRVHEIVETFDGPMNLNTTCILGLDECCDGMGCALHAQWKLFREKFAETIASLTLSEVATTLVTKRGGTGATGGSTRRGVATRTGAGAKRAAARKRPTRKTARARHR